MPRQRNGTYYMGRIIKLGGLTESILHDSLLEALPIKVRDKEWTIIDAERGNIGNVEFLFGRLCKYDPSGEITTVDPEAHVEIQKIEPNLKIAVSPFVYIPTVGGIAFLQVSNDIPQETFVVRFAQIINRTHNQIFAECSIEMIADLESLKARVGTLSAVYQIRASVRPPNPLWGPLWDSLKDYVKKRAASELKIDEQSATGVPLKSTLPSLIKMDLSNVVDQSLSVDIGDAAFLMASDGYGEGTIRGKRDDEIVIIKTSEALITFQFDTNPTPNELFTEAFARFNERNSQTSLRH